MPSRGETQPLYRRTAVTSAACALALVGALVLVDGSARNPSPRSPPRHLATAAPATATTPIVERARVEPSSPPAPIFERRRARERPAEAERRLARAEALGAHGAEIDDPCVVRAGGACTTTALEPFFATLDALARHDGAQRASVAVLGNSLIAADHIVDVVRERLVERFGDGGRGFVLTDRIAEYGGRARTGSATTGRWAARNFSMGERGRFPFGVAGVLHVSRGRGAKTTWTLAGETRARVFVHEHARSPALELLVDGAHVRTVHPEGRGGLRTVDLDLSPGARTLALEAKGPGAVVYGALLERRQPGVIVNSFGVPAADAAHFLSADEDAFRAQLLAQDPALVVVMLGGNETKRLHWGKRKRSDVERDYAALLDRLREIAPRAACLAVGPIDSVYGGPEKVWRTRTHLSWVIAMQKRVAVERGCAYFDLFEAMGGAGSLRRFATHGLLHADMVHPKKGGLDLLGELFADALLDAYETSAPRAPNVQPRANAARERRRP